MRAAAGLALGALLAQAAVPAAGADSRPPSATEHVTVRPAEVLAMRPGTSDTLWLVLDIAPGYHVQANPAAHEFLIPLTLELEPVEGVELGAVVYPRPTLHRLEATNEVLLTCEDTVAVAVPVAMSRSMPESSTIVRGTLTWQACDAKRCFAPRSAPVELRITAAR